MVEFIALLMLLDIWSSLLNLCMVAFILLLYFSKRDSNHEENGINLTTQP